MEAGELPKEVDGPFSRQFRKDEEGNSSKIWPDVLGNLEVGEILL